MSRKSAPVSLAATVGNLIFPRCFMNAPGTRSMSDADLDALGRSRSGGIAIRSSTLAPRPSEPDLYLKLDAASGSSIYTDDLGNLGYEAHAAQAAKLRRKHQKPIVASISGFTATEFARMAERLGQVADALELDVSGPNLAAKGQFASDPGSMTRVLSAVCRATDAPIWVKLPPYQEITLVEEMADLLRRARVAAVVAVSGPAGLDVDIEQEATTIRTQRGLTALGGKEVLRIARWNIRELHRALGPDVPVVGVGGVSSGADVYGHILCGASLVLAGTAFLLEGPALFARLEKELLALMKRKGVTDIRTKMGALVEE